MIPGKVVYASLGPVTIPNSLTTVGVFDTLGVEQVLLEITVATNALVAFQVNAVGHDGNPVGTLAGPGAILASAGADYTTPKAPIIKASADLTTLAVGNGWALIDTRGIRKLQIRATSGNAGGSPVTLWATGA